MPILAPEVDLYPDSLFDHAELGCEIDRRWWAIYTLSRREKDLMRKLRGLEIPHYAPMVTQRKRAPNGRVRVSQLPLFPSYVFLYGDNDQRYQALTTNCISRCLEVDDGRCLTHDLQQLHALIATGCEISAEPKLQPGTRVRVKSGMLQGKVGVVTRRQGETRLVVAVNFLQQGASVLLDDADVEPAE